MKRRLEIGRAKHAEESKIKEVKKVPSAEEIAKRNPISARHFN